MDSETASDMREKHSSGEARPKRQGVSMKLALVASGVVVGMILAGFGVATAQGGGSSGEGQEMRSSGDAGPRGLRRFRGGPGHPGVGLGMPNLLHGEGVVGTGEGETENVAMQVGKVVVVNGSSVEVKSTDGFTRTYAANSDTKVFPRGNDIGDVDEGDQVRVFAVVDGDTATAKRIVDITDMPHRPGGPTGPPPGNV